MRLFTKALAAASLLAGLAIPAIAQPPVNLLVQNSVALTGQNSNVLPFGTMIQLIYAGPNNVIDPVNWGNATHGMPSGDDVVMFNSAVGNGVPPIEPFAGMFNEGMQVFSSPTPSQLGVGYKLYARIFNANTIADATWYTNTDLYTCTNVNGQEATLTQQTSPLAPGTWTGGNPNPANNPNGSGSQQPFMPSIPNDPNTNNQPPAEITFPAQTGANTNPGQVMVSYNTTLPPNLPGENTINRFWNIETDATNFENATLVLHFTAADLPAGIVDPTTAVPPLMAMYTNNGGSTWTTVPLNNISGPFGGVYDAEVTGLNHFSLWGLGNGGVLPVELNSFTATGTDRAVSLNWSTATEINNDFYSIDRKSSEEEFATIARVNSQAQGGNSSTRLNYHYDDSRNLVAGVSYSYRLTQTDLDGSVRVLREVSVVFTGQALTVESYNLLTAYPNPFNPTVNIRVGLKNPGYAKVALYNSLGRLVQTVYEGQMGATRSFVLDGSKLASGAYFVELKSEQFSERQKLVLMR